MMSCVSFVVYVSQQHARFSGGRSVPKEKGSGSGSPSWSCILEKSTLRAFIRGGVPVLKRRRESPSSRSRSASGPEGASPSGPESRMTSPTMVRPLRKVPVATMAARQRQTAPVCVVTETTRPSSTPMSTTSAWMSRSRSCRSSVRFMTSWYLRLSACARSECTAGPLPRFSIRYWIQAASAALAISPPRASSSRTRWPLPVPPMAGLQGMLPTVSRFMAKQTVSSPRRAGASAASIPAWPAPMTAISHFPAS